MVVEARQRLGQVALELRADACQLLAARGIQPDEGQPLLEALHLIDIAVFGNLGHEIAPA